MTPQQAADLSAEASRIAVGRRAAHGILVLRSLKQAYYSPRNLGHAGLASPRYCHFTSPIRRYPDVVAHRALLQGLGIDHTAAPAHELDEMGVHCSATERSAMQMERAADDICLAFLLERRLADADPVAPPAFEGEVVGLIDKGAFVRFGDERFEGLLPARRLRGWWSSTSSAPRSWRRSRGASCASARRSRWWWSASRRRSDGWISRPPGHTRRAMAKKRKRKAAAGDVATNRQASFRFNLLEKLEAGIVLQGSEVKSLRNGSVQLKDAYAEVREGEVWLRNMHIAPYDPAREGHEPERPRKLLLHRREIERLIGKTAEKGLTLVPTRIYFSGSRAKVELAVAQGKDMFDKRRSIKDREQKREMQRALSER